MKAIIPLKELTTSFAAKDNVAVSLRWNWGEILLFVLIWSYGFENVAFSGSALLYGLLTVGLVLVIAVIDTISRKYRDLYQEEFQVTYLDIAVLVLYSAVLVTLGISASSMSLVGDQIYHAQASQIQSIRIAEGLIHFFQIPAATEFKSVVGLVNWAVLLMLIAVVAYVRRLSQVNRTVNIVLLFCLLKFLFLYLHVFYFDPHPPFRLFPLWLGSALFGLNDVSFRLVPLFSLSVFAFLIYKFCRKHLDSLNSFLIGMSVGSIPLLWHVSSVVEQSVWTALSWTFILIAIKESSHNPNYVRWISVVAIASLMRAPAFVALVPIVITMGIEYLKSKDYRNVKKYLIYAAPVLVLIPFLGKALVVGTAATSGQEVSLRKIMSSLEDGFSIKVMYYNILLPWLLFLPFCFIPMDRNWLRTSIYAAFFLSAYCVFYSINPGLWGVPRYQSELGIPFVILGFYSVALLLSRQKASGKYVAYALAILIAFNAVIMTHLNWINLPVDSWTNYFEEAKKGNVRILSEGEGVFNIREALQAVRKAGYSRKSCKVGITYGTFSEMMTGYNIEEMENARLNFPDCSSWGALDIAKINNNRNIELILFVDRHNKKHEIDQFVESGQWVAWKDFHNEKFGSTIMGIVRKQQGDDL